MIEVPAHFFQRAPQLVIDGNREDSASDQTIEVVNPSNGRRLTEIPAGSEKDVDRAVSAARRTFESGKWSSTAAADRKAVLTQLADLIVRDASDLDAIDAAEMGKPVSTWRFNARAAADHCRFYAEATDKITGVVLPTDGSSYHALRPVPRGVVGAITPWNFPTYNAVMKIAPALAAGNSLVLKPSELSSFSALRLAQLASEAGVPPGVFNVVLGSGGVVGKALALHNDVDMITFTGSTAVGKLMLQYSGLSNMKNVLAECGGKCPQIVFDDGVDLDAAADFIALYLLTNQGQVCSAGTRLLVQKSIEQSLLSRLASRFGAIRPGMALDPETTFGPLVSRTQLEKVIEKIRSGHESGAELVLGGGRLLTDTGGFYLEPTIFRMVPPSANIAQDEIFGPVLSVSTFETANQAAQLANGTRYGLNAYVWTASMATGMQMAESIRSTVSVRSGVSRGRGAGHAGTGEPIGDSGIGAEGGLVGLSSYLRHHSVGFFY
ncbi:aldehyde dehydrogenase family protein [Aminobacter aganoensis]|uniref:aldehyde dehydrogenase (NAD(+)) n=1 Tax=Aminobacter aganoensis TaxID=83264 RepID=A0A7X0FCM0_9HYPH|nr:aldehyde dehydrogenase family protein [Aminobacter aganoensis]MBB6357250.1 acyl-CoA reductase-like NAD-dependent aldehyde dehydrogenase [Aminobacter aganoensis]